VNATKYERNYAIAVETELADGILKNSVYSCKKCIAQLQVFYKQTQKESQSELLAALANATIGEGQTPAASLLFENEPLDCDESDVDSADENEPLFDKPFRVERKVPKMALVNGHFRGKNPECLSGLTRVEMSMIVRINCVYSLSMLKGGCHWGSTASIFSVLNDVNVIAKILPRMPTEKDWAIIRSALDSASPREFTYLPYKVVQALLWLEENNQLWEGTFQRPVGSEWAGNGSHAKQDAPGISTSPEDYEYLNLNQTGGEEREDGNPVNPGAPTNTTNILLVPSDTDLDLETQISSIIQPQR
jgi:hypothetical protein